MKFKDTLSISCGIGLGIVQLLPVFADTETTTVKTTTITREVSPAREVVPIVLPSTTTYLLVDPITGTVKGNYDPNHSAIDSKDLVPGLVVIDQVTGKIVATVNSSGQTLDVISAPAFDTLVSSIDARRTQLDAMLTQALSNGTIDAAQAATLRAQLEKIVTDETTDKLSDNVLTYSEALSLATALNVLQDQLVLLAHAPVITPLLAPKFMSVNGQVIMVVDDLDARRMKLSQRVDDEYTAGRLSANQVSTLKERLDMAAALESKYKKNGELSPSKKDKVATKLDSIETEINTDVAIINSKRAKIGIRVQ